MGFVNFRNLVRFVGEIYDVKCRANGLNLDILQMRIMRAYACVDFKLKSVKK